MKKMVITGVNGFIGRHAKEYFEKVEFIFAEARRQITTPIITRIYVGS